MKFRFGLPDPKAIVLQMLVKALVEALLSSDYLEDTLEGLLDIVEQKVKGSETKVDDAVILPISRAIRARIDQP